MRFAIIRERRRTKRQHAWYRVHDTLRDRGVFWTSELSRARWMRGVCERSAARRLNHMRRVALNALRRSEIPDRIRIAALVATAIEAAGLAA